MSDVILTLVFDCQSCHAPVSATLRCAGLAEAGKKAVASVSLPCPRCGAPTRLLFDADGAVLSARRQGVERIGPPSMN